MYADDIQLYLSCHKNQIKEIIEQWNMNHILMLYLGIKSASLGPNNK